MKCSITKKKSPGIQFDQAELVKFNTSILDDINASNGISEHRMGHLRYNRESSRRVPVYKSESKRNLSFYGQCFNEKWMPLISENIQLNDVSKNVETHFSEEVFTLSQSMQDIEFRESFMLARLLISSLIDKFGQTHSDYLNKMRNFLNSIDLSSSNNWTNLFEKATLDEKDIIHNILVLMIGNIFNLSIFISGTDLSKSLMKKKNINLLFYEKREANDNLLKNLVQQLGFKQMAVSEEESLVSLKVSSQVSEVHIYLMTPKKRKSFDLSDYEKFLVGPGLNAACDMIENIRWAQILLHRNTWKFLRERNHQMIPSRIYVLLRTFYFWQYLFLKPIDRIRFLLAGSSIKAAYGLRDAQDIDFLVLDHDNQVEKYGKYMPNIGVEGLFDDFGKTYYSNEEYYFPMIPEMYDKQKELKAKQKANPVVEQEKKQTLITNNFPPYSVSGLKIGRYFSIFKILYKSIADENNKVVNNLDDLILDPFYRIHFCGCNLIDIRIEFIRDIIKDIDLKRISKKQMHDFDVFATIYSECLTETEKNALFLERFIKKQYETYNRAHIQLRTNLYHTELKTEDKVGYGVMIKHAPSHLTNGLKLLIKDGPLFVCNLSDVQLPKFDEYYENVLLSSLPNDGKYWLECNSNGQFNIYTPSTGTEITSIEKDVIYYGQLRIIANGNSKKYQYNLISPVMEKIKGGMEKTDQKDYLIAMANLIKNYIQMHKLVDCHTKEKVIVEFMKEKLF